MDADAPNTADPAPHHIPLPPPPMMDSTGAITAPAEPVVANPFGWEDVPLRPGQLAPGWHTLFIAGWVLVMVSFGCVWQAARVSGIAPWWLGPETNPRFVGLIILPFIGPLIVIAAELVRWKASVFVGIVVGLGSAAFALGDLHFPGLAIVEAIIGLAGLLVSLASVGGRMRHPDRVSG
ncbi:MAG: hypothetical protein ABIR32_13485 [Ilumatobacteraceae bacterium]